VSGDAVHQPTWPLLQKIEHMPGELKSKIILLHKAEHNTPSENGLFHNRILEKSIRIGIKLSEAFNDDLTLLSISFFITSFLPLDFFLFSPLPSSSIVI
jgi:hypothetical protein